MPKVWVLKNLTFDVGQKMKGSLSLYNMTNLILLFYDFLWGKECGKREFD